MHRILATNRSILQLLNNCSRISSVLLKVLIINRKKVAKTNGKTFMKSEIAMSLLSIAPPRIKMIEGIM